MKIGDKMDYDDKKVARNIKAIRNANKKSQADFANVIVYTESYLSKVEAGIKPVSDDLIHLLSKTTGFSYNEIKYGDLTYLEKGDLSFDKDFSLFKSEDIALLGTDLYKAIFPIVNSEEITNEDFRKGISIVYDKIQILNFTTTDCITAINYFIYASSDETCADYSAINILSCFGYLYLLFVMVDPVNLKSLITKNAASLIDFFSIIKSSTNNRKQLENKKIFFEKYNSKLTKYMSRLVNTQINSDYAYYYLAIRYLFGMMDETITMMDNDQMRRFADSLLDSLRKMGNKYAKAFYDFVDG